MDETDLDGFDRFVEKHWKKIKSERNCFSINKCRRKCT